VYLYNVLIRGLYGQHDDAMGKKVLVYLMIGVGSD